STGMVSNMADSNFYTGTTTIFSSLGDSDLDSLSGITTYDGCILDFNAVPSADTLYFNYCFGSEEYPEFVFAGFNDPFAVLISGPGITGRINATTLPGGSPVTIDNVNDSVNTSYYFNNETPPGRYITYDGFTTNLMAFAQVIPDSTYHFKVAIADAGDGAYDSGVMLEAFSFRCVAAEPTFAGIHENTLSSLNVYPNPGTGNFYINDKEHVLQDGMVRIMNVFGQEIFSEKTSPELTEINISNQATGIYFVNVITNKGIYKAKILKK
ncbi:MAG: choice-of-anchor L domain-containing protein, partial [Bacteroidetes bacterium]|nr:choice-of-anchor L domain-containing protein [Bacteroidota bacterium]